ncbi:hypothetical protein [Streptomyces sp. MZ04]|nr:hypothetical protein [Streptomyces sp. MZ04]
MITRQFSVWDFLVLTPFLWVVLWMVAIGLPCLDAVARGSWAATAPP